MQDFIFRISPNIVLGSYTVSRLGIQALEWGSRYMVIIDPILNEVKMQEKIISALVDRKLDHFVFSELTEGTSTKTIQRALALAKESHVQGIIAVGGAKALNIGRCVAALYNEVHDFYNFVDGALPTTSPISCICVPTTFRTPFVYNSVAEIFNKKIKDLRLS